MRITLPSTPMTYSLADALSGVMIGMPALPAASSTGASAAGESGRTMSRSYFSRTAWRICWICVWTLLLESCVVTLVITSELGLELVELLLQVLDEGRADVARREVDLVGPAPGGLPVRPGALAHGFREEVVGRLDVLRQRREHPVGVVGHLLRDAAAARRRRGRAGLAGRRARRGAARTAGVRAPRVVVRASTGHEGHGGDQHHQQGDGPCQSHLSPSSAARCHRRSALGGPDTVHLASMYPHA